VRGGRESVLLSAAEAAAHFVPLGARLTQEAEKSNSGDRNATTGAVKPTLILNTLRGAEAPLFHCGGGIVELFRS